jgi:hypothetical protein
MQFDKTSVGIRERSFVDQIDLATQLVRRRFRPWALYCGLAAVPMALLNHALLFDLVDVDYDYEMPLRYLWCQTCLILIEAPLVSLFFTPWIGLETFFDRPKLRGLLASVWRALPSLIVAVLLARGVGFAWIVAALALLTRQEVRESYLAETLLPLIACWGLLVQAVRPYVMEIVLLERPPLRKQADQASLGQRSAMLHNVIAVDSFLKSVGIVCLLVPVTISLFGSAVFVMGTLTNVWYSTWFTWIVLYPLSIWIAVAIAATIRFLAYLDARIRQEGWEVELQIRAEASRLHERRMMGMQ